MRGYQSGCVSDATALIRRVSPMLHRLFAADAASRMHADDLLQETWLRIHRVRHTYRTGQPLMPWLYAIARHVRIDHYRRTRRAMDREESVAEVPEVEATGAEAAQSDELDTLLAALSPNEREVIELLKIVGLSLEEVARTLSCSVGSVKQKAHRAYKKLRRHLHEMRIASSQSGAVP